MIATDPTLEWVTPGHPLFEADAKALDERFTEPGPLIDLTG